MATILALKGAAILCVSLVAGLLLYGAILRKGNQHGWHLLHAGGSGRGLLLLALAATIHLAALDPWLLATAAWLIIFFAWASTIAMLMAAATGERGFRWADPVANRLAHALYVMGATAVFPAFLVLILGLVLAL